MKIRVFAIETEFSGVQTVHIFCDRISRDQWIAESPATRSAVYACNRTVADAKNDNCIVVH
jgi:hypothetical protein